MQTRAISKPSHAGSNAIRPFFSVQRALAPSFFSQSRFAIAAQAEPQAAEDLETERPEGVVQRKRAACDAEKKILPQLEIGRVDDPLESEADVMADHVVRRQATNMDDDEREAEPLQAKAKDTASSESTAPGLDAGLADASGSGASLAPHTRYQMEEAFGADFSAVRVHTGAASAAMNDQIGARAFTYGTDIHFNDGEYTPATNEGRRLIAHELAHVVQQDGGFAGHASGTTVRRQPLTKPTKHTVTRDEVVQTMTGLGGHYADTAAWEATMQSATFLGHAIAQGVRPEFKTMLATAESKVKDEYKKSGNTPPSGYGIKSIGGYRPEISPHGAGVAIDIDGNDNPYILHEGVPNNAMNEHPEIVTKGEKRSKQLNPVRLLQLELQPVYNRIAQFILNSPIGGEQSIIPKLITTGSTLPPGGKATQRERAAAYYDRLALESNAMKQYFALMTDDSALKSFLAGDWAKLHPGETPPSLDDVKKQMWHDYVLLGGAIPNTGLPGSPNFKLRPDANRPFHPARQPQRDPASGFLTIPREVVLGLKRAVPRWGAIDFGPQSGDVMHFDDKEGIGKPFFDAKEAASAKAEADFAKAKSDYEAAVKAEAGKNAQQQGGGGGSGAPTQQQGSGSGAPTPQRKAILGAVNDPLEQQADAIAERVTRMEQPAPASVSAIDHAHLLGPLGGDRTGVVRRARKKVHPEDVAVEMVGQKFRLRKPFTDSAVNVPAGEVATVTSWDNASGTVEVTSPSVKGPYHVPKFLLDPERVAATGIAPYGVGLGKEATGAERAAADVAAFQKTESQYKKNKAYFAKELSDLQGELTRREGTVNERLIQATMLNRFDVSIRKWVDFYNAQFGFKDKDALDPNLIKAVAYQESGMGTSVDIDDDPTTGLIVNRFNILQAVDTLGEEQIPVIQEIMPGLVTKYHLDDVVKDWKNKENELDDLRKKKKSRHPLSADERARLTELTRLSRPNDNWQIFFWENNDFMGALKEFLNDTSGGKKRSEDYDFWIRTGVRAVFEKHEHHRDWADAARAFNGGGRGAKNYRKLIVDRAQEAVKAEKAGKEYVPRDPEL
jgi:hypothetical protein